MTDNRIIGQEKNKPKMAWFFKFESLVALTLNFNRGQFYKKIYKNLFFSQKWKKVNKIIKIEVENF